MSEKHSMEVNINNMDDLDNQNPKSNVSKKELLDEIFGKQEPMTEEEKYDAVMAEAERIYLYQESMGNVYSFHKAYEWAKNKIEKIEQAEDKSFPPGH